jgi:hypothetical protein
MNQNILIWLYEALLDMLTSPICISSSIDCLLISFVYFSSSRRFFCVLAIIAKSTSLGWGCSSSIMAWINYQKPSTKEKKKKKRTSLSQNSLGAKTTAFRPNLFVSHLLFLVSNLTLRKFFLLLYFAYIYLFTWCWEWNPGPCTR